jgi:hypothetical protein
LAPVTLPLNPSCALPPRCSRPESPQQPRPRPAAAPPRRLEALRGILPQPQPGTSWDFPGTPPRVSLPTAAIARRRCRSGSADPSAGFIGAPHVDPWSLGAWSTPASTSSAGPAATAARTSPSTPLRRRFSRFQGSVSTSSPLLFSCVSWIGRSPLEP